MFSLIPKSYMVVSVSFLGVLFLGVLMLRSLLFFGILGLLIFRNSRMEFRAQARGAYSDSRLQ